MKGFIKVRVKYRTRKSKEECFDDYINVAHIVSFFDRGNDEVQLRLIGAKYGTIVHEPFSLFLTKLSIALEGVFN